MGGNNGRNLNTNRGVFVGGDDGDGGRIASGKNGGRSLPNAEVEVGIGGVALISWTPLWKVETRTEGNMEGGFTWAYRAQADGGSS